MCSALLAARSHKPVGDTQVLRHKPRGHKPRRMQTQENANPGGHIHGPVGVGMHGAVTCFLGTTTYLSLNSPNLTA
eukprot:365658-Chlamydomonas_euryale.AAC.3